MKPRHGKPVTSCIMLMLLTAGGCAPVTRYTDGPITRYFAQPIPKTGAPIARTLSIEKISFQTAASMKAVMISDIGAREIYFMPADVGREVKDMLKLDQAYDLDATYRALNYLAKNREKTRRLHGGRMSFDDAQSAVSSQTRAYITKQEQYARESYRKGDYLKGNIHNSAATNALVIDQSSTRAQATVNLSFSILNAAAAAGEALIKRDFILVRDWIESKSGAIGNQAPFGRHLSVFFLQFFDAKPFQLDSRNRVAVLVVLSDHRGIVKTVLEGSDILNCQGTCDLFKPKPSARVYDKNTHSEDVKRMLGTPDGIKYLMGNGFDALSGIYQYILLQHALDKISRGL